MIKLSVVVLFTLSQTIQYFDYVSAVDLKQQSNDESPFSLTGNGFRCTFSGASDQDSCLQQTDDGVDDHCVWCPIGDSGYSVCVNEKQAESMEEKIPGLSCVRYNPTPSPPSPSPPKTLAPTKADNNPDHTLFKCLSQKYKKDCLSSVSSIKNHCTWCDTKGGYGICLNGAAAESAKQSDWYINCTNHTKSIKVEDNDRNGLDAEDSAEVQLRTIDENGDDKDQVHDEVTTQEFVKIANLMYVRQRATSHISDDVPSSLFLDNSCLTSYVKDQTELGCTSSFDMTGKPCQWCSLAGVINICLTIEQATSSMSDPLGIVCDAAPTILVN